MAEIIPMAEVRRARRRQREREYTSTCINIIEANLQLALQLFASAPLADRSVRARQIRQLAELLEYVTGEH